VVGRIEVRSSRLEVRPSDSYAFGVPVCAECGKENPEGARFCNACAAPLAADQAAAREERKVVTVLFADLVGFTGRAEQLDPEDERARL
jgi:class 3 adenylate cyclase